MDNSTSKTQKSMSKKYFAIKQLLSPDSEDRSVLYNELNRISGIFFQFPAWVFAQLLYEKLNWTYDDLSEAARSKGLKMSPQKIGRTYPKENV